MISRSGAALPGGGAADNQGHPFTPQGQCGHQGYIDEVTLTS
jgi:hypothetical protein